MFELLLIIYGFIVWLIFIKFKLLPWVFISKVIVCIIPIIGLATLWLLMNVFQPYSNDVRVLRYVVPIVSRVTGRVIEVDASGNTPVKKGDVLYKIDPRQFQYAVNGYNARLQEIKVQESFAALRLSQARQLSQTGAGPKYDFEDYERQVSQYQQQILQAQADLDTAKQNLAETVVYAPSDGTVINLQLRPGALSAQLPMVPVMSFVENTGFVVASYPQNALHQIAVGDPVEITLKTMPGKIIKATVDSIILAQGQGQVQISGTVPTVLQPPPSGRFFVRFKLANGIPIQSLPMGASGNAAIYTESLKPIRIIRQVIIRVMSIINYIVF